MSQPMIMIPMQDSFQIFENILIQRKLNYLLDKVEPRIRMSKFAKFFMQDETVTFSLDEVKQAFKEQVCKSLMEESIYMALTSKRKHDIGLIFKNLLTIKKLKEMLNDKPMLQAIESLVTPKNIEDPQQLVQVVLASIQENNKIQLIKEIHDGIPKITLKEAKDLVCNNPLPNTIAQFMALEEAVVLSKSISRAGGFVILKGING